MPSATSGWAGRREEARGATPATGAILVDLEAPLVASYRLAKQR